MYAFSPVHIIALQLFILIISIITALFEIQVEGPHGWATYLPTWRVDSSAFLRLLNGKELTGYHLYFYALLFLMFHFPLLISGWSTMVELTILSCFFEFTVFWDFLWFILNPYFGWKRFLRGNIWWFRAWVGYFPLDYYAALVLSAAFATIRGFFYPAMTSGWLGNTPPPIQHFIIWVIGFAGSVITIALIIIFLSPAPLHHAFDKDHAHEGEDDKEKTPIHG